MSDHNHELTERLTDEELRGIERNLEVFRQNYIARGLPDWPAFAPGRHILRAITEIRIHRRAEPMARLMFEEVCRERDALRRRVEELERDRMDRTLDRLEAKDYGES